MNIAICDDEKGACLVIEELVRKADSDAEISVFTNPDELLNAEDLFDLVFLDIQMDEMTGIDAAKRLRTRETQPEIVFISAVQEYVFDAFDVEAFHYLIKPVDPAKFAKVYDRVKMRIADKKKILLETEEAAILSVKSKTRQYSLKMTDVLYVENQLKKLLIHTKEETIDLYGAMKDIEAQTGDGFFRCHRGYLVNLGHIKSYSKDEILLDNGERIMIAKERYPEFIKAYMHFLR